MGKRVHVDAKQAFVSVPDVLLGEVSQPTPSEAALGSDRAGYGGRFFFFVTLEHRVK